MNSKIRIKNIEDTRKLVDAWLSARVYVEKISEDDEDNIMWMILKSSLGTLELRRDVYPLDIEAKPHAVRALLSGIPGSPYSVADSNCGRPESQEIIDLHEKLWQKYFHKDWKRLDFLLGQRGPSKGNPQEPTYGDLFKYMVVYPGVVLLMIALVIAALVILV